MLKSIIVGLMLTVVTVGIHAAGTTWWIERLRQKRQALAATRQNWLLYFRLLGATAVVLLSLHIIEVAVWAIAYLALPIPEFLDFEDAIYFSTVTFTALGYGDVVIAGSWRLLAAVQAMAGLLIFGWSTALLFAVVQRLLEPDSE